MKTEVTINGKEKDIAFYSVIFLYSLITTIFFFGTLIYNVEGIYSDQYFIAFLQILIYGIIINCVISTVFIGKKSMLVMSNGPILFALYFNLVFSIFHKFNWVNAIANYIVSIVLAMGFILITIYVTSEKYFTEKIWNIAIYLSLINIFELENNKYFSAIFLVILAVNLFFKLEIMFQKKIYEMFPDMSKLSSDNILIIYGTLSIVYWCCLHYIAQRIFKNNLISFISLGFVLPNISIMIQYAFPGTHAIMICFFFFFFLNTIMVKAETYANNVVSSEKALENLDKNFEEILKKKVIKMMPINQLKKTWSGFKQFAKNASLAGGGPGSWGPKAGAAIGLGSSIYFGSQYIKDNAEANRIAVEQNRIAVEQNRIAIEQNRIAIEQNRIAAEQLEKTKEQIAAQERANEIALEQLKQTKKSNKLLAEGNQHAAAGANAAIEYNAIAREQGGESTTILD